MISIAVTCGSRTEVISCTGHPTVFLVGGQGIRCVLFCFEAAASNGNYIIARGCFFSAWLCVFIFNALDDIDLWVGEDTTET